MGRFLGHFGCNNRDCIPRKQSHRKKSPWITDELKQLIRRKHVLFSKAKSSRSSEAWQDFKHVRNKVKNASKSAYWKYVSKLFSTPDNKQSFWRFVREQKKSQCPASFQKDQTSLHKPADICQAFNDHFISIHSSSASPPETPPPCPLPIRESPPVRISLGWLQKNLLTLTPHKAPGPDGISPTLLRATARSLAPPLLRVMNCSLADGALPADWKLSQITPVFKSGKRCNIANYRPVALTSIICKVLERAVADNINEHMSSLCLSNPNQHGFTSRKSCVTQLTNAIHNWAGILDAPHPPRIDVIFLDFSKAFDVMPHHILLDKLARLYNIRGQTWTWLKSFLLNRKQRVLYKGSFSDWAPVTSGVPQGSVL